MRKDEIRDSGTVLAETLGEATTISRDVHRAVARRIFGLLGKPAEPVRLVHDSISETVYGAVGLSVRNIPPTVTTGLAAIQKPVDDSAHDTRAGHAVLNALGGWMGDRLAGSRSSLAPRMGLRGSSGVLRVVPENLAHDLTPTATGRLAVLLHGLGETDRQWGTWTTASGSSSYAQVLREQGWTPVFASYNTGLAVETNATLLSAYLDRLLAAWPVPPQQVALIGHSMGGLVVHRTAALATEEQLPLADALSHVVALGTPFAGAPLERFAEYGSRLLDRLPETRPFSRLIDRRSAGIKDLRRGIEVAPLPGVEYFNVSATLAGHRTGPFGHDLLVTHSSARGHLTDEQMLHVPGKTHFHLLGDATVAERLATWLRATADPAAMA